MWGPVLPQRPIHIEGHELLIRQNLLDFLQTSHVSALDHVWIDQICIDQQNLDERNHQVQLMAEIFSNAAEVLIWLGLAEKSDTWAINHIANREYNGYIENALIARYTTATNLIYIMPSEALQPPPEPLFSGICKFMEKPYWNRLWIVQEIFLGRARKILCGDHTLSWESFHAFTILNGSPEPNAYLSGAFQISAWTTKHRYVDLDTVLYRFSAKDCEDPRDKIYGLQALVEPEQRMAVDYHKSLMQIFIDSFVHALDSPFGRPADLRRASHFCHKLKFGSTVIILPALPAAVTREFLGHDFSLLAAQRTRVATHMGMAVNYSLLYDIISELITITQSKYLVSCLWPAQWVELMLDDALLNSGEKWVAWKEQFQFQEEEYKILKVERVEYAEYVRHNSFKEYRRWRCRHGAPSKPWS